MTTPTSSGQLRKFFKKNGAPTNNAVVPPFEWEEKESVVREMRLQGSLENNTDPNDMPLEVAKNLEANLGSIDTEAEIKAYLQNNKKEEDNLEDTPHPRP